MYSRNEILKAIDRMLSHLGFTAYAYENFDLDLYTTTFKIKIEDRYGNEIDTIKIDPLSFNEEYLNKIRDKLSNKASDKSTEKIIPIDKDKQIVKIHEGKSVIIQFNSMMKAETIKLLREDIQNQIKENGFAVVDGKCKIVEFDNPKYLIETK